MPSASISYGSITLTLAPVYGQSFVISVSSDAVHGSIMFRSPLLLRDLKANLLCSLPSTNTATLRGIFYRIPLVLSPLSPRDILDFSVFECARISTSKTFAFCVKRFAKIWESDNMGLYGTRLHS